MTDIRATIVAATLAEHVWDHGGDTYCSCGWDGGVFYAHQAASVLAALDADPRVNPPHKYVFDSTDPAFLAANAKRIERSMVERAAAEVLLGGAW